MKKGDEYHKGVHHHKKTFLLQNLEGGTNLVVQHKETRVLESQISMQTWRCHYCKKKGHIKRFFRKLKLEQKSKGKEYKRNDNSDDEEANVAEEFNIVYDNEESVSLKLMRPIDSTATIDVTS